MQPTMMRSLRLIAVVTSSFCVLACGDKNVADHDILIRGGFVYDGLGNDPVVADVAIDGDKIAGIGDFSTRSARLNVDAREKAVAPGFINMLSWANESLIEDGRAMSDIKQGVTLEIMGEGWSMGPLNPPMKADMVKQQSSIQFDVEWTTLGEYLDWLVERGISPNIASYVGAATVRIHELGYDNRAPSDDELDNMRDLVRQAMAEGALGVGSSLIYAPANFADTDELIALVGAAAETGGTYISHIRSEGHRLEEGVQELIKIASVTGAAAEIYHLKAAGRENWHKLQNVFALIEAARSVGIEVSADIYTYTAGATGLDAAMPLWVQEGGHDSWVAALQNPEIRARVIQEIAAPSDEWESLYQLAGAENVILLEFKNKALRSYIGKTLADVAAERGTSIPDTIVDLVIEDDSRVGAAYVLMSEDNVRRKIQKNWITFGSDAAAPSTSGVFLESNPHPRAYGTFARLLGRYVRDEHLLGLADAIRRITSLPAYNANVQNRGQLSDGFYADVVVFDPRTISDHADFENPHQYATGVEHVFVNGVQVLNDGEHTGATPGRVVRGPGWTGWSDAADAKK